MVRDGIKTPKDTNFIVGILECGNHRGEKAKRKAHDVQRADDRFRQPLKFASAETSHDHRLSRWLAQPYKGILPAGLKAHQKF